MREFKVIPESYTENFIGNGYNAFVYKLNDKEVFKKFYKPQRFESSCKELSKMYSDTFIYPKELVYENGEFVGYIMDYVEGNTLDNISENTNIQEYIDEVKRCEYEVAGITTHKYYVIDFKEENIMYTSDHEMKFIDTDYYFKFNNKYLYQNNITSFSVASTMPLMNVYNSKFRSNKLNHYKELLINYKLKPSSYFNEVIDSINKEVSDDVETLKDARNGLKLILK